MDIINIVTWMTRSKSKLDNIIYDILYSNGQTNKLLMVKLNSKL